MTTTKAKRIRSAARPITALCVLSAACALLLGGCSMSATELEQRAVVETVGIDVAGDAYTVTVSYHALDAGGGSTRQAQGSAHILHEAFDRAVEDAGGALFWGHASYLVLGREAAENKADDILLYLSPGGLLGADIGVCVAQDRASDLVTAPVGSGEGVSGALDALLKNKDAPLNGFVRLFQIARETAADGTSGMLPVVELKADRGTSGGQDTQTADESGQDGGQQGDDKEAQEEVTPTLAGLLLMQNGAAVKEVAKKDTAWTLAMLSRARTLEVQCETAEGQVFALVGFPSVTFVIEDADAVDIGMTGQLDIACVVDEDGAALRDYDYDAACAAVERTCAERLEQLFSELCADTGIDLFGLSLRYQLRFHTAAGQAVFGDTIALAPRASVRLKAVA